VASFIVLYTVFILGAKTLPPEPLNFWKYGRSSSNINFLGGFIIFKWLFFFTGGLLMVDSSVPRVASNRYRRHTGRFSALSSGRKFSSVPKSLHSWTTLYKSTTLQYERVFSCHVVFLMITLGQFYYFHFWPVFFLLRLRFALYKWAWENSL